MIGKKLLRAFGSMLALSTLAVFAAACGGGAAEGGGATAAASEGGAKGGLVGSPAPDFSAEPVTGSGPKTLGEAKGKIVILDFWGTFCEPCKKSFPKYQGLADQFGGDLAVLAVSVDEADGAKKEDLQKFAKDTNVKFAIVWDKDHQAVKKYNPATMPSSFIIDKQGVVRFVHTGYKDGEEAKIAEEVKSLLK